MSIKLRDFKLSDSSVVNAVAVAAFEQFRDLYSDWSTFVHRISGMASLSETGEIIVAEVDKDVIGAVAYVGPDREKALFFEPHWPIMRMLVVSPKARGIGAGRALADACIARAYRDKATIFALHTSPIMSVALPMYGRMGFRFLREAPPISGVPYGVYVKELDNLT